MAFLNYENKRGSGKNLKVHFILPKDDDYHIPDQKDSSSSISSDSSRDSDSGDSEKDDHHNIDNIESKNDGNGYNSHDGSVTQFPPPMQMMNPSGYDPNRIPSSIFSSPSHMEWSVQSNESLFSIHLGNTSFSRDHVFALNKSEEFPWTNDLISMPPPMILPPVQEVALDDKQVEIHSVSSDTSEEIASLVVENDHKKIESPIEAKTLVVDQTQTKDHSNSKEVNQAMVPGDEAKNYNSASYRSMESDRSFQFPILTVDEGRNSSSTVESEKQEKKEHHQQQQKQQPEKPVELPKPETEKEPLRKCGRSWCFCFSCSPCCF